jgi:hypothetical protein
MWKVRGVKIRSETYLSRLRVFVLVDFCGRPMVMRVVWRLDYSGKESGVGLE